MSALRPLRISILAALALVTCATTVRAAISWDAGLLNANMEPVGSMTSWWFDPANWSPNTPGEAPPHFNPPTGDGVTVTDTNVNSGWDLAGEGVVYDPVNDPFFEAADDPEFDYPTEVDARLDRDTIWRLYLTSSAATVDNKLTIKSGTLEIVDVPGSGGFFLLGRGGASPGLKGTVVQTGGTFRINEDNIDIGHFQTNPGTGIYDYRGGTLEAGLVAQGTGGVGIRLGAGGSSGATGSGTFIVHNGGAPGHIRAFDFNVAAHVDATFGTTNSVNTVEFFANAAGTRPIQVVRNLVINHQDDSAGVGNKRSAVLKLGLEAAPNLLPGGIPINLGLFDVDFDDNGAGAITGVSMQFFNNSIDNGGVAYSEGSMVSASLGGSTYNWTISYTGDITWSNTATSVVGSVTGPGTGNDVVLIGHSSVVVPPSNNSDFDNDGDVDGADYLRWQAGFGLTNESGKSNGNANADLLVNGTDFQIWKDHFGGAPSLASQTAIPEPSTLVLFALGIGLAKRRVAQRRRHPLAV